MSGTGDFPPRQGSADTLLWVIERDPLLRSTIVAVALLDGSPEWSTLRDHVGRAVDAVPRLRQRVRDPWLRIGPGRWEDVDVDLDYHLRRVSAPTPGDLESVFDLAAAFATTPLDRRRALWEFTLVSGLDGGDAFIQKLHHSLTDGIGGVHLALALYEPTGDVLVADDPPSPEPRPEQRSDPPTFPGPRPVAALRSVGRLLAPAPQPMSPLLSERGLSWRFGVHDLSLEALRGAGHRHGGSVNDAFMTAVVRGLAHFHADHGQPVDEYRVLMPVSIRAPGDPLGGNRFVPVRMRVPALVPDAGHHLEVVHELTTAWRAQPALRYADAISTALTWMPRAASTFLFGTMLKGCDLVVTDVPGFDRPVSLAGVRVRRQYAFAPPSGAALNAALLSHGDTGCVGLTIDAAAIADRHGLDRAMQRGLADVLDLAPERAHQRAEAT